MSTFLTDRMNNGYTKKEVLDVLFESEQEKERRRILAIVTKTADALRLKNIREFLAYQQLATWRRMNGFDRVEGEESCFHDHRSLPPTPQEYYAGLWSEVNSLKEAISMPAEDTVTRPRQKDSLDELLSNFEFARTKEYVEKRSRGEAAQVQVTVTQVNTVQHCSPCSPNPDMPSGVYFRLEDTEGEMGPELDEPALPSAGTGLKTPGQQSPPNEGTWETRRTITDGYFPVGMGSIQGGDISSPKERVGTRDGTAITPANSSNTIFRKASRKPRDKTPSEENKQFDPRGRGEKPPPWNAAVILFFLFLGGALGHERLLVCASCFVRVCLFPQIIDLSR